MQLSLPASVRCALEKLNQHGYEAYAVGGCVRDSLLGNHPNDWDITTSALPEQIMAVFSDYRVIPTGIQHGTVTVLLDDIPLEITTFRIDGSYSDSRHPDHVTFTRDLPADLARRDFTVNALAYHPTHGLIDHFSGLADLDKQQIVCVGDPEKRFTEDALRILRALRFSAQLGFSIEKITSSAIHRLAPLLRRVAAERIQSELTKLVCGAHAKPVLLAYADVIGVIMPTLLPLIGLEQNNPYHFLSVYEHTVETVVAIKPDRVLRLTMLLHDCGKPSCYTRDENGVDHFTGHAPVSAAIAEQTLESLRYDRQTIDAVKRLVLHHDDELPTTDYGLKCLLHRFGEQTTLDLMDVQKADVCGQHPDKRDRTQTLDALKERVKALIAANACYRLSRLAVKGKDLQEIGFPKGRVLGDMLETLLDEVMAERLPNERAALMQYAQNHR